jgi:hypothetical protein
LMKIHWLTTAANALLRRCWHPTLNHAMIPGEVSWRKRLAEIYQNTCYLIAHNSDKQ